MANFAFNMPISRQIQGTRFVVLPLILLLLHGTPKIQGFHHSQREHHQAQPTRAQKLIVDTDAGFDVDDIGALAVANALQDAGEAEIIGVSHTNGFIYGIGAVSTIMEYYNTSYADTPLGAYKGPWARDPNAGTGTADRYVTDLVQHYPSPIKNSSMVPTAVDRYRALLAAQPDHSVAIASIGITTNMRDLVLSKPDSHSKLNGSALIAQKVSHIVWMDGFYNFGCAEHDTQDWLGPDTDCRGSAKLAVDNWPSSVKQIFSGLGADTLHGNWLTNCATRDNPVRRAFEDWLGPNKGRSSWDPITVLTAVRGPAGVFCKEVNQGGHDIVDEAGHEQWASGRVGQSNQSQLAYDPSATGEQTPQEAISFLLNQLVCRPPGPWLLNAANTTLWNELQGANCYGPRDGNPAHGATDLEKPPSASCGTYKTVQECQARCAALAGCTAVTVRKNAENGYDCYRKADVSVSHCDLGTDFSTYVAKKWWPAIGLNCFAGHGAKEISGKLPDVRTARGCKEACEANPNCTAVVFQSSQDSGFGQCYLRADVVLDECLRDEDFDMYLMLH